MMAEETKNTTPATPETQCAAEEVVISDAPVSEEAKRKDYETESAITNEAKILESAAASFKEESNKVDDLVDPEKKALDELKVLVHEALNKHEFTSQSDEEKMVEEENKGEEQVPKTEACEENKEEAPKAEACEEEKPEEPVKEEKKVEPSIVIEKAEEAVEEIKETTTNEVKEPPETAEKLKVVEETAPPQPPEEVSLWGIPLLADERIDLILLKFLRARDFKVKEAFAMLKSVVAWRRVFKIDELLEEDLAVEGLEKVVYMHGVDKEGHPVCYNAFGEFQDKELYGKTFGDAEKRAKFLKWYIQSLEKNVRKLEFSPDGTCTFVQITDLKNTPGLILFKKDLRQATNQAFQLLQDNYPEFVAKQVFINVPWWYVAYNRMISPFLTQRTRSKFVFAGPTKTADTLFKYIAPEQVPVPYGGLSKEGEQEFTTSHPATEEIIKPTCKHTVEIPITEPGTLVWEVRVLGWDVGFGAEFVTNNEDGYTWILQKSSKIGSVDERVISRSFKIKETGKVVLTFDNQTSKKKKLLYRFKTKSS